ncbi:hypothetical protein [Streptomyces sp. NBC_00859]|uniref:hypothetical protein n=1 Tax=Streptomyces sp. NBC_00859 TaxID=2903682 RepID=UPI00386535E8|nr:hypothetical protein OG584_02415 [Streptomyces sp. NBC_00859]
MPARYHLRFHIHPTSAAGRQAAELADFCLQSGVDEVVLLLGAEEFYNGHPAGDEEDRLYDTAATSAAVLRGAGLDVSLNPWVTAGHADRGRRDRHGFAPMVGPDGQAAAGQASFACPRWRAWITAHYARFAGLGFRVLWLEDDFRYHNHAPLEWGGGFEPLMLERLAELAGEPVTREAVVAAVTAPGAPHPWRALLQETWRTAQLEVAALVADAVEKHSAGRSRLGLMSSVPGAHAVEGRDWPALFDALSIGGEAVHRPHFAPYSDAPGRELSHSLWTLDVQRILRPPYVRTEPEIENWPHTTWSKSDTQTWSEMVTAQICGADALFLNVLPVQSGHARRFPGVTRLLRRSRPALDHVAQRHRRQLGTCGVGLPLHPDASAHVHTERPGHLADLAVDPGPAADFLLRYGVPVTAEEAPVRVLFGQVARSFDDDALRRMLSGGLLVDGTAARILTERGFGELLGVTVTEIVDRRAPSANGPYSLECVPASSAHAADADVCLSVNLQPALARLCPSAGAEVRTSVLTADLKPWGPGRCEFTNSLGGRVAVLAATAPHLLPYDDDGRRLLHATVRYLEGDEPVLPLVSGGPYLIPRLARTGQGWQLAVTNGSADPARPRIALADSPAVVEATLLAPLAEPASAALTASVGTLLLGQDLPHRGWLLVEGTADDGQRVNR